MQLDTRNNSKLMWFIAGGLIIIVALASALFWLKADQDQTKTVTPAETKAPAKAAAPPLAQPVEQTATSETTTQTLVDSSILQEPVSENESLAKEEIAKLDDIQTQLKDQQQSLESQHADADQLIKLKEEQLKLLEQQLAAEQK